MDDRCTRHQFEAAVDSCRTCGSGFCRECLVYSFGPERPPFCLDCALTAAGVRATAARTPTVSKRELRQRAKGRRKAHKNAEKAPAATIVGPGVEIDWSVPAAASGEDDGLGWLEEFLPPSDQRVTF